MSRRFFSDASFWNQPIEPDPPVVDRSDELVALMDRRQRTMYLNMLQYTIPVYEADASTPLRTVHQRGPDEGATGRTLERQRRYRQHPDFGPQIPIPDGAVPDPAGDAHLAVIDRQRQLAWDMWYVRIRDDGEYESATGMAYRLDGEGIWRTADFPIRDGESMHFHGPSRAAGVPAIAGLVMHEEIRAGRIDHKLALATNNVFQQYAWPATWTDGGMDDGPCEGMVLQLDPDLDLDRFGLRPAAATLARAMQTYGAVNVDGALGNVLYLEGLYGHADRRWDGLLDPDDLRGIPMHHYRWLQYGPIVRRGDGHHRRTG